MAVTAVMERAAARPLDHVSGWALGLLRSRGPLQRVPYHCADGVTRVSWCWLTSRGNHIGFAQDLADELVALGFAAIEGDTIAATAAGAAADLPIIAPPLPREGEGADQERLLL